jgi:plasmid stabilization system protein ParE
MYAVMILEEALEDLRNIVAYIASENPSAAKMLGGELLDEAMSLESLPYRGSRVKKRRDLLKLIHGVTARSGYRLFLTYADGYVR